MGKMEDTTFNAENTIDKNILYSLESDVPKRENLSSNLRDDRRIINKNTFDRNPNIITTVNGVVLLDYLSPEINNNEEAKRKHKYILITLVAIFLFFQFSTVYKMSMSVMHYAIEIESNIEILKLLIGFVSAYITSVVVELIAILKYVVKRVFDTSIKELIELFKEDEQANIKGQED